MASSFRQVAATVAAASSSGILASSALYYAVNRHEKREIPESAGVTIVNTDAFDRTGARIVRNVLSPDEVSIWKARVREAVRMSNDVKNVNGRLHFIVAPTNEYHPALAKLGGEVWRNRRRFRLEETEEFKHCTELTQFVHSYFSPVHYGLTQLQFLTAIPDSTHQIWHRDNTQRGLTAIIALTNVTHGPTELILGSHRIQSVLSAIWNTAGLMLQSNDDDDEPLTHAMAYLNAGDAIIYDSRLLHRGRGYSAVEFVGDRPVLVLRWDADLTPPPGSGMILTAMHRYGGFVLSLLVYWKDYLEESKKRK